MWIHHHKRRHTQHKSRLVLHDNGSPQALTNDGDRTNDSLDLRANPFQQGGYDVPHHWRLSLRSPRKEELESGSPMVSYDGPITQSRVEFINLITHLDDKKAVGVESVTVY